MHPRARRRHDLVALAAIVLAAAALLPVDRSVRLLCSGLAAVAICVLLIVRLRAHRAVGSPRAGGTAARIARIRAGRERSGRR
jgi:hypothetical protein